MLEQRQVAALHSCLAAERQGGGSGCHQGCQHACRLVTREAAAPTSCWMLHVKFHRHVAGRGRCLLCGPRQKPHPHPGTELTTIPPIPLTFLDVPSICGPFIGLWAALSAAEGRAAFCRPARMSPSRFMSRLKSVDFYKKIPRCIGGAGRPLAVFFGWPGSSAVAGQPFCLRSGLLYGSLGCCSMLWCCCCRSDLTEATLTGAWLSIAAAVVMFLLLVLVSQGVCWVCRRVLGRPLAPSAVPAQCLHSS